jgi:hypothetical protein
MKEALARRNGLCDDQAVIARRAQEAFLARHLANWAMAFAHRLATKAPSDGPYSLIAALLGSHLEAEFMRFGLSPNPPGGVQRLSDSAEGQDSEGCLSPVAMAQEVRAP